jgi:hypothetical protein
MDLDVFVALHWAQWQRLEELVKRRRLTGEEADELVALYQQATTHLSQVQSASPDPALLARLTTLVARARSAVTAPRASGWRDAARYFTAGFPAAVYRTRWWWLSTAAGSIVLIAFVSWWVDVDPAVRAAIAAPDQIREMTRAGGAYQAYYSDHPATAFAAQVWTNNAWYYSLRSCDW